MIALASVSSNIIQKFQDHYKLQRWTYITVMGKENKKTIIFTVYRPDKKYIESVSHTTVIKQQYLQLQRQSRNNIHPHNASIDDLIKELQPNH